MYTANDGLQVAAAGDISESTAGRVIQDLACGELAGRPRALVLLGRLMADWCDGGGDSPELGLQLSRGVSEAVTVRARPGRLSALSVFYR